MRTNVYIDAFNLYYGCLKNSSHKWLDPLKFCQTALPKNDIHRIRYFTAQIKSRPDDPQQPDRQRAYLRALKTIPNLSVHLGQYLETKPWVRLANPGPGEAVNVQVMKSEEKGSDVNLATYLLLDAFDGDCDAAVVISNDSDLIEPIRIVRKRFHIPVVILHPCRPPRRPSVELKIVSSKSILIEDRWLGSSQFPETLSDEIGSIHKPAAW